MIQVPSSNARDFQNVKTRLGRGVWIAFFFRPQVVRKFAAAFSPFMCVVVVSIYWTIDSKRPPPTLTHRQTGQADDRAGAWTSYFLSLSDSLHRQRAIWTKAPVSSFIDTPFLLFSFYLRLGLTPYSMIVEYQDLSWMQLDSLSDVPIAYKLTADSRDEVQKIVSVTNDTLTKS